MFTDTTSGGMNKAMKDVWNEFHQYRKMPQEGFTVIII
jgi:hypothetical protein